MHSCGEEGKDDSVDKAGAEKTAEIVKAIRKMTQMPYTLLLDRLIPMHQSLYRKA